MANQIDILLTNQNRVDTIDGVVSESAFGVEVQMATRVRPTIGERCFEVEWCAGIPLNEYGDRDHDQADNRFARFKSRDAAIKYAKSVLPKDAYGSVSVCEMVYEAYDEDDPDAVAGFWTACGEPEYIDE